MTEYQKTHFDSLSEHYENYSQMASMHLHFPEIDTERVRNLKGPIADLGSGTGAFLRHFNFPASELCIAIDRNKSMLERIEDNSVRKITSDLADIPLESASVGVVLARQVLQYLHPRESCMRVLREATRILRPSGWMAAHHMTLPAWDIKSGFSAFMSVSDWPCRFVTEQEHLKDFHEAGLTVEYHGSKIHRRKELEQHFCMIRGISASKVQRRCAELPSLYNLERDAIAGTIIYDAQYTFVLARKKDHG